MTDMRIFTGEILRENIEVESGDALNTVVFPDNVCVDVGNSSNFRINVPEIKRILHLLNNRTKYIHYSTAIVKEDYDSKYPWYIKFTKSFYSDKYLLEVLTYRTDYGSCILNTFGIKRFCESLEVISENKFIEDEYYKFHRHSFETSNFYNFRNFLF